MNSLSIQSHVAYGHVGNSAAVFPLQRLGFAHRLIAVTGQIARQLVALVGGFAE